jgi:hypothetical protein
MSSSSLLPSAPMANASSSSSMVDRAFSTALEKSVTTRQTAGKRQKSVTISEARTVHEIQSVEDYSEEERYQTWFTRNEFRDIKASYRELILRMSNREYIEDTDQCSTRGLEGRSRANSRNRQNIIMTSILAVLNEQDMQRSEGRNDPETLAIAYRHHSYHPLQAASMMGRRDETAIAEYTGRTSPSKHDEMPGSTAAHRHHHQGTQPNHRLFVGGPPAVVRRPAKPAARAGPVHQRRAAAA